MMEQKSQLSYRYDVVCGNHVCFIEYHFCRDMDCFGNNPNHGFTWEEAKQKAIEFYQSQVDYFKNVTEDEYFGNQ